MIFEKLKHLLAEAAVLEPEEIEADSHFEDDLGMNIMEDFPRILALINGEFGIKLKIEEVLDELEEMGETFGNLAKIIEEECELG
jgi:acyl carrier protein